MDSRSEDSDKDPAHPRRNWSRNVATKQPEKCLPQQLAPLLAQPLIQILFDWYCSARLAFSPSCQSESGAKSRVERASQGSVQDSDRRDHKRCLLKFELASRSLERAQLRLRQGYGGQPLLGAALQAKAGCTRCSQGSV